MTSLRPIALDATYRNIWNECISEEFMDDGFSYMVDPVSGSSTCHLDGIAPYAYAFSSTCQRGLCREPHPVGCVPIGTSSSTLRSLASPAEHAFTPSISLSACHPLILGERTEEPPLRTISVTELGDSLCTRRRFSSKNDSYPFLSACSSPASSDISLASTSMSTSARRQACQESSSSEEEPQDEREDDTESDSEDDDYRPYRVARARVNAIKDPSFSSRKAAVVYSRSSFRTPRASAVTHLQTRPLAPKVYPSSRNAASQRSKPRAKQVDASVPFVIPDDFRCLHCNFEQTNHRLQDFKRHVANHFRSIIYWECCGVPVVEAAKCGSGGCGKALKRGGALVVGGCGRNFGRKDAYKRHLDDHNNNCIGDIDASWHPGNAYKDFD